MSYEWYNNNYANNDSYQIILLLNGYIVIHEVLFL